ncbi:hypothetical protein [Cesiribacter andamanensis]|uniref:Lipocalin-like domain-containing protein n=1 Tax=Cesiribacter andamanensis AMV16 TaxID=1279009 RepID=M7NM15_9BACT|nr:hypothetical protein [Cesiribacter andamanensis]EMR02800.1 hypothetical protein ADICEAN_02075 [Cesiribacter andamanensis AMV16]
MNHRLLFVFLLLLGVGCKKPEPAPLPENMQRLTAGDYKDWRLEKVVYLLLNVSDQVPACQRDEIYRFYADGQGEIRSGQQPCQASEPEVQNRGTWEFKDGGARLLAHWKDRTWDASVDELQPDKLVVTGLIFDNYVVTATFRPQ